jgi:hypothetical protein
MPKTCDLIVAFLHSQLSGVLSPADACQRRIACGLHRVRGFEMRVAGHGGSARLISHLVRSWGHAYRVREDKNGRGLYFYIPNNLRFENTKFGILEKSKLSKTCIPELQKNQIQYTIFSDRDICLQGGMKNDEFGHLI